MELKLQELISQADASYVSLSGAAALDTERIKMLTLSRIQQKPRRRTAPRILLAAAIAAALAVSALAYAEFRNYDHPMQMLEGFYGDSQQESVVGRKAPWGQLPDTIRVALDKKAAALVSPCIAQVGRTVRQGDTSLTVHGNLYDSVTGCGILYFTVENPGGISYEVDYDGMVRGLPVYGGSRHGYPYLLKEASGDTRAEIAEYYIRSPLDRENYIEIGLDLPNSPLTQEAEFDREQRAIQIPLEDGGGMPGLTGQGIRLSPIGISLDLTEMDFLKDIDRVETLEFRFRAGDAYLVQDENHRNYVFGAGSDSEHLTLTFNRLVDVETVQSVVVNGRELDGFRPMEDGERLRYGTYVDQRGSLDTEKSSPSGSITFEDLTLIPGSLLYSTVTGNGLFDCSLQTDHPEKLLNEGNFLPWDAKLQSNLMIRWQCLETEKEGLRLRGTFINLEKAGNLKLWFEGSKADPRLETSTENLLCLALEETSPDSVILADGAITVSDLGMIIDYRALGVQQESMPRDLILLYEDGTRKILSSWDEDILDCGWLWTGELRDSQEKKVYVSFLNPEQAENIAAVTYAGRTFTR